MELEKLGYLLVVKLIRNGQGGGTTNQLLKTTYLITDTPNIVSPFFVFSKVMCQSQIL